MFWALILRILWPKDTIWFAKDYLFIVSNHLLFRIKLFKNILKFFLRPTTDLQEQDQEFFVIKVSKYCKKSIKISKMIFSQTFCKYL